MIELLWALVLAALLSGGAVANQPHAPAELGWDLVTIADGALD